MLNSKPSINLMFLGGAGDDVTGSSTLVAVEIDGETRYGLIDVGGYQGEGNRNFYFPVNAPKIDFVIITHSHYDHIGLLPKLYKEGFSGVVYITQQTREQGHLIMQDAASINVENSEYKKIGGKKLEKTRRSYETQKRKVANCRDVRNLDNAISQIEEIIDSPLYTLEDVKDLKSLYKVVKPYTLFPIYKEKLFAKLIPTTHHNGSVQVELYYKDKDKLGILFSGDIGPDNSLLYKKREEFVNTQIDYGVIESLHGTEDAIETLEESAKKLEKIIREGIKGGKNVILAGFSLDRNSMLVYLINRMKARKAKFKAYFDAPLALKQNQNYQNSYRRESEIRNVSSDEEVTRNLWFKDLGKDPFSLDHFNVITAVAEHIKLLNTSGPKVIVTASANGNGGRIVDFFDKYIQDSNTVFVFCGWIYPESPSSILHNTEEGKIVDFGTRRYIKRCQTYQLHGFTSHGRLPEVFSKLYSYPKIKKVILNHGEPKSKKDIKEAISKEFGIPSHIPELYDAYSVSKESIRKLDDAEILEIFDPALIMRNMDYVLDEINKAKARQT